MCVQMLNPQRCEYMIDTASGSCAFPVHTIFKLTGHLFTNEEIPEKDKQHLLKVFGIDFYEKTVRFATNYCFLLMIFYFQKAYHLPLVL